MNWFTTKDLLKREGPFTMAPDYIVLYLVAVVLLVVGLYFLIKHKSEKTTKIVLIVLWAIAVALDAMKLIKNIATDFNIRADLPFYVCSIFMYVMPVAIWGKGIFRKIACALVCSISLFGVIGNYVVPTVVVNYSLFSFSGFHTTLYHLMLLAAPLVILCTGYYKFSFKDIGWTFLGFVVITLPVMIFDWIAKVDYMYFLKGSWLPLVGDLPTKMGFGWVFLLYFGYAVMIMLMQLIVMGITKLVEVIRSKSGNKHTA